MRTSVAVVALSLVLFGRDAGAERTLAEYRYFRALTIDLVGRPPTRVELEEFEAPQFKLDAWIDKSLTGASYAVRLRQIYMDLLRLDVPETLAFRPPGIVLRWTTIHDARGRAIDLYFRDGQRRALPEIDGQVCFTQAEIGVQVGFDGPPVGTPKRVSQKLLDARTVLVKPWWLYSDYRERAPRDRAGAHWTRLFPGFDLLLSLFVEPDGRTPQAAIRVCREEAQRPDTGRVFVTRRIVTKRDTLLPGRLTRLPADTAFALANVGRRVSCATTAGFESSLECGCGVGLERCVPAWPNAFVMPWATPLGPDDPFFSSPRPYLMWLKAWWSQEVVHFLDRIFVEDRDMREVLTSRSTVINGPLAQFYRHFASATCCGAGSELGQTDAEPLFEPAAVPPTLTPHHVSRWTVVPDRGARAAGLMTMPIFLVKYGSRRQRAHAVYSAFLCKEFVAETAKLEPSAEPDLTKRPGCAACHRRLEPLATYFARVKEADWTYLPPAQFPVTPDTCGAQDPRPACKLFYEPAFVDPRRATLRGAHAAPDHADAGPAGLAKEITTSPEFAPCVVRHVAQSLLGRPLTTDDAAWKTTLVTAFVDGGYRMRALVRAVVTSPLYRDANDRLPVHR